MSFFMWIESIQPNTKTVFQLFDFVTCSFTFFIIVLFRLFSYNCIFRVFSVVSHIDSFLLSAFSTIHFRSGSSFFYLTIDLLFSFFLPSFLFFSLLFFFFSFSFFSFLYYCIIILWICACYSRSNKVKNKLNGWSYGKSLLVGFFYNVDVSLSFNSNRQSSQHFYLVTSLKANLISIYPKQINSILEEKTRLNYLYLIQFLWYRNPSFINAKANLSYLFLMGRMCSVGT